MFAPSPYWYCLTVTTKVSRKDLFKTSWILHYVVVFLYYTLEWTSHKLDSSKCAWTCC